MPLSPTEKSRRYWQRLAENEPDKYMRERELKRKRDRDIYYKERLEKLKKRGASLREINACKNKLLEPDTIKRKESKKDLTLKLLEVETHYANLLKSRDAHNHFVAVCWFRATKGVEPCSCCTTLKAPHYWRFHASDLLKNYHPKG
jgi:hypothetical protein